MQTQTYCIYSGKNINKTESSVEHIIPLSLGGSDDFIINVNRNLNSIAGSKIDGKMANDFLVKMNAIKNDFRGHSRKEPILKIKKAKIGDSPVSVHFKKSGLEMFDPIKKEYIKHPGSVEMQTSLDLEIRIKFISKVVLAAGYFIYGETFVKFADHNSLRKVVFSENLKNEKLKGIKFYDNLHPVKERDKGLHLLEVQHMKYLKGSSVTFILSNVNIIAHVGLGGIYIGTVNFKASTKMFPNDAEYRLGKVLVCKDGVLYQDSYWNSIYKMNKVLGIVEIDDSKLDI